MNSASTQRQVVPDLSKHAAARIRQRGITERDVNLIRAVGESVEDGVLMTNRAIDLQVQALRREMIRLERLRGIALIECDNKIITVYRADKKRMHRLLCGESSQR